MCGICGIYEYGVSQPSVRDSLIVRMRDTMTHRGPDDAGVYVTEDRRVGLGNRRLSIVDLSPAGRNPMANEDGQIWITFNGEIYNHQSLRPGLVPVQPQPPRLDSPIVHRTSPALTSILLSALRRRRCAVDTEQPSRSAIDSSVSPSTNLSTHASRSSRGS